MDKLKPDKTIIKNQIEKKYTEIFFQNLASVDFQMLKFRIRDAKVKDEFILVLFGSKTDIDDPTLEQIKKEYGYDNPVLSRNPKEKIIKNSFESFTVRERCVIISKFLNDKYAGSNFSSRCTVYETSNVPYLASLGISRRF
jgi:hypothetical protein